MEKKENWCTPCSNPKCAAVLSIKITIHQYGKTLKVICPKCKKDISNEKCVSRSGEFLISMMALTMGMIGEKESNFRIPPHLRGMVYGTCYKRDF